MHDPRRYRSFLTSALALVLVACGGSGGGEEAPAAQVQTYIVDAKVGSDANPGTTVKPFLTLTHAIAAAGPGATIEVRPGRYDAAHGERFPLQLLHGQRLFGDVDARGLGAAPTTIAGQGQTTHGMPATILMAHGSWLSGFAIEGTSTASFHYGVQLRGVNARIENNTFAGPMYGGIYAERPAGSTITRNDFYTTAYGAYLSNAPGMTNVSDNRFHTPARGIRLEDVSEDVQVERNAFLGPNQIGVSVESGSPRLRRNSFRSNQAVQVHGGSPNLGTPGDPGRNDFSGSAGTPLRHNGSSAVSAVGNTWRGPQPYAGTDIQVGGSGAVIWGSDAGQRYSQPAPFGAR